MTAGGSGGGSGGDGGRGGLRGRGQDRGRRRAGGAGHRAVHGPLGPAGSCIAGRPEPASGRRARAGLATATATPRTWTTPRTMPRPALGGEACAAEAADDPVSLSGEDELFIPVNNSIVGALLASLLVVDNNYVIGAALARLIVVDDNNVIGIAIQVSSWERCKKTRQLKRRRTSVYTVDF